VTQPEPHPGDAEKAVENAQLALETNPAEGRYWNTLAAAQYRAKNWQETKDALMRSMELRGDGDGYDWILFALLYSQTGPKSHARAWYDKAARWRADFGPWDRDLYVFESEAAERLDLPIPPTPTPRRFRHHNDDHQGTSYRGRRRSVNPFIGESRYRQRSHYSHWYGR
jgi:tetratricopeptide (TPR) repeat protein